MSHAIPFDTLAFVKELEGAGVPLAQAEAQVKVLATVVRQMDSRVDNLSTKRDRHFEEKFDSLADRNEERVKGRLDGLATKQELDLKIKELDVRIATMEANLKRDIKELDTKTETRLKELELRMVIKMGIMILGGIGLIFGLMRAWPIPVQYVPPTHKAQEMHLPMPPSPPVSPSPR